MRWASIQVPFWLRFGPGRVPGGILGTFLGRRWSQTPKIDKNITFFGTRFGSLLTLKGDKNIMLF